MESLLNSIPRRRVTVTNRKSFVIVWFLLGKRKIFWISATFSALKFLFQELFTASLQ
jgi:hypothetical protein